MSTVKKIFTVILIVAAVASVLIIALDLNNKVEEVDAYVIRANDEKIALYSGEDMVEEYPDIVVSTLPVADRERLKAGIEFTSLEEARRAIEDYDG